MKKKFSHHKEKSITKNNEVCSSVFVSVPRPISFIKGDTVFINEIEDESIKKYSSMVISHQKAPQGIPQTPSYNPTELASFNQAYTFKVNENCIEENKHPSQPSQGESIFLNTDNKANTLDVFIPLKLVPAQEAEFHYLQKNINEGIKCAKLLQKI